jgi:hypothetical protein
MSLHPAVGWAVMPSGRLCSWINDLINRRQSIGSNVTFLTCLGFSGTVSCSHVKSFLQRVVEAGLKPDLGQLGRFHQADTYIFSNHPGPRLGTGSVEVSVLLRMLRNSCVQTEFACSNMPVLQ